MAASDPVGAGLEREVEVLGTRAGVVAMASMVSARRSLGCGDVKRTRRMPGTAATARRSSANSGRTRTRVAGLAGGEGEVAAVAVDVLAQQGDLGDAVRGEPLHLGDDSSNGRLISRPRTAGTMQKAQVLSQPIWIVTQAL